jgi:hypothetical protein
MVPDSGDTIGQLIGRGHNSGAAGIGTAAPRCTPVRCVPARRATPMRYRHLRYSLCEIYDPIRCRPIKSRRLRCIPAKKTHSEMHAYEVHVLMRCAYLVRCTLPIRACEIHAPTRYMPVRYTNKKPCLSPPHPNWVSGR